jgi:hypothetical protein
MSGLHFIYIPLTLIVGIVIGFIIGGRAAKDAAALEAKNKERRAAARAEREARIAAAKDAGKPDDAAKT